MAKRYSWLAFIASFIVLSACSPDQYSAGRPVYFDLPDFELETDYLSEGTSNSRITTVWIYVDNDLEGTYELPFTVPVLLEEGSHEIRLFPGINLNGISSSRAIYPFFERPLFDTTIPAGLDTFLIPLEYRRTQYTASATVEMLEDFDEAGINLLPTASADSGINKVSDAALVFNNPQDPSEDNGKAGVMFTSASSRKAEVSSVKTYDLPRNGENVYLEMNYRCNEAFIVGVIANSITGNTQQATVIVNPREDWNKIYINLVTELTAFRGADNFNIFIGAIHDSNNDTGWVYLDNLKLVF